MRLTDDCYELNPMSANELHASSGTNDKCERNLAEVVNCQLTISDEERFQGTTKVDDAVSTSFDRTSILLPNKNR